MPLYMAIAKRIQILCKEKGITINAMTYKAGIPSSTVKNIFYGKSTNPGIGTIKIVCDALDISLADFFDNSIFANITYDN